MQNYTCAASLHEFISITFFLILTGLYKMVSIYIVAFNPFPGADYKQVFVYLSVKIPKKDGWKLS